MITDIEMEVSFVGDLSEQQRQRLLEIASASNANFANSDSRNVGWTSGGDTGILVTILM